MLYPHWRRKSEAQLSVVQSPGLERKRFKKMERDKPVGKDDPNAQRG